MVTSEDVRRVTFDKVVRGYRCEDVDDYLKQVADSLDALTAENVNTQKKLHVLAERIEQYRAEEDTLHTALINAQRLGENVIKEAKQKATEILRTANMQAEDREQSARDEVELCKQEVTTLKKDANDFKKSLLDLYRQHIELISKMPEYQDKAMEEQPVVPPAPEPDPAFVPAPVRQPEPEPMPELAPEMMDVPEVAELDTSFDEPTALYDDTTSAAPKTGEKVDTVEFAIAPHEEEPEEAAHSAFAPGAGLYDIPEDMPAAPKAKAKGSGKSRGASASNAVQQPDTAEELPSAFDSFAGIDFDS